MDWGVWNACMNDSFAFRIGLALSRYLCEIYSGGKIKVAIGQDTRASGAALGCFNLWSTKKSDCV